MLEVEYSGKHRMPFSTRKIANKIATALRAELMKQRLACFDLQVTAFERKPGVGGDGQLMVDGPMALALAFSHLLICWPVKELVLCKS